MPDDLGDLDDLFEAAARDRVALRAKETNPRGLPGVMPPLPVRVEPAGPPALPPRSGGFRTPPPSLTATGSATSRTAPRAPWWRWAIAAARGLRNRLDLRRRRHAFHHAYPDATWKQCQRAAEWAQRLARDNGASPPVAARMLDECMNEMGPRRSWPPIEGVYDQTSGQWLIRPERS